LAIAGTGDRIGEGQLPAEISGAAEGEMAAVAVEICRQVVDAAGRAIAKMLDEAEISGVGPKTVQERIDPPVFGPEVGLRDDAAILVLIQPQGARQTVSDVAAGAWRRAEDDRLDAVLAQPAQRARKLVLKGGQPARP
jgi:hypothetical protein